MVHVNAGLSPGCCTLADCDAGGCQCDEFCFELGNCCLADVPNPPNCGMSANLLRAQFTVVYKSVHDQTNKDKACKQLLCYAVNCNPTHIVASYLLALCCVQSHAPLFRFRHVCGCWPASTVPRCCIGSIQTATLAVASIWHYVPAL